MSRWLIHDLYAHIPECEGFVPLAIAFAQIVALDCDEDPLDQELLAADLQRASCVQEVARWFFRLLQSGQLKAISRPLGGGAISPVPAEHWHIDNGGPRLLTSRYCRAQPFENADPDHWLFVEEAGFLQMWEARSSPLVVKRQEMPDQPLPQDLAPPASIALPPGLLMDLAEVEQATRMKRSHIYNLIKKSAFPPQVRIGGRALWRRSEVESWVASLSQSP